MSGLVPPGKSSFALRKPPSDPSLSINATPPRQQLPSGLSNGPSRGHQKQASSDSPLSSLAALLSPLLSSVLPTPPATPQIAQKPLENGDHLSPTLNRSFSEAVDRDKDKRPPSPLSLTTRIVAKRTRTRTRTRARRLLLVCIIALAFASVINNFFHSITNFWSKRRRRYKAFKAATGTAAQEYVRTGKHPIRVHLERSHAIWKSAISQQSQTAAQAGDEYQKRYGREPPEGFDDWFAFAKGNHFELPDEFDGMMDSLEPFWAMLPSDLRRRTVELAVMPSFSLVSRTERGETMTVASPEWDASAPQGRALAAVLNSLGDRPGLGHFAMTIEEAGQPRVLPSWEETERVMSILTNGPNKTQPDVYFPTEWPDPLWDGDGDVWTSYVRTCPPDSVARRALSTLGVGMSATSMTESGRVEWLAGKGIRAPGVRRLGPRRREPLLHEARVASTLFEALDSTTFQFPAAPGIEDAQTAFCSNPTLHDQHNMFFSDYRTMNSFYPVFSTSKIDGFADILIPSLPIPTDIASPLKLAVQGNFGRWSQAPSETPWDARDNRLYWRGAPTGEAETPPGYELNFARPRLVRKMSLQAEGTEDVVSHSKQGHRQLAVVRTKRSALNARTANVAFTTLAGCGSARTCATLEGSELYTFAQHEASEAAAFGRVKAVIDVDGMGDSTPRFARITKSGAAAIRGSILRDAFSDHVHIVFLSIDEHHVLKRAQIMPWVHYIPLSPDFRELYHLHAYFLGSSVDVNANTASSQTRQQNVPRHEGTMALRRIAQNGQQWRQTHIRPVDAEVYIYRLALEWSRLWARSDAEYEKMAQP